MVTIESTEPAGPKLPSDPDELRLPMSGDTSDAALRDVVWKWLGIPESLWPMAELMGVIVAREKSWTVVAPKRGEFVVCVPRPSDPRESVKWKCADDCHTWGEDGWTHVFVSLLDYARDTR